MKTIFKHLLYSGMLVMAGGLTSCLGDGSDSIILENAKTDIPSDADAKANPVITGDYTATMPNIQTAVVYEDGNAVFRIDMTGIQDRTSHEWIRLYGTNEKQQNVWVEVDDTPKGIKVYNTIDDAKDRTVPIDMIFLVDNSGSMDQEANAIARDIIEWATYLDNGVLDIQFACVGYDGAITGAIDLTSVENLSNWLQEGSGTSRTRGFSGPNARTLENATSKYRTGGSSENECGMAALRFANDNFNFTRGSNRIYVNFTDEPNQPAGNPDFSVEWLKTGWEPGMGTIHTVFSDGRETGKEYNYLMSDYTGGTVLNTNSSFSGVSLFDLPVTDAVQNSYIIRLTNIQEYMDRKPHRVKITVKTSDRSVQVERIYNVIFVNQ